MEHIFKYLDMKEDALLDEIESLNKRLFKMSSGPMRDQMMMVIDQAQMAYQEKQIKKRIKVEDTVLDIGYVDSEVIETNYSSEEMLNIIVQSYTKSTSEKK